MGPEALAKLHALCFTSPRPWRAEEFADVLATRGSFLVSRPQGFAIGRIAGPEAELLTIAVHPADRNRGIGAQLLGAFEDQAKNFGVEEIFLEVAENNAAAIALYKKSGFKLLAKRKEYFKQIGNPAQTALIFKHTI